MIEIATFCTVPWKDLHPSQAFDITPRPAQRTDSPAPALSRNGRDSPIVIGKQAMNPAPAGSINAYLIFGVLRQ
jgi:hypothetical protein